VRKRRIIGEKGVRIDRIIVRTNKKPHKSLIYKAFKIVL